MQKLGMRYKGVETWHEREVTVYQIDRAGWLDSGAA